MSDAMPPSRLTRIGLENAHNIDGCIECSSVAFRVSQQAVGFQVHRHQNAIICGDNASCSSKSARSILETTIARGNCAVYRGVIRRLPTATANSVVACNHPSSSGTCQG